MHQGKDEKQLQSQDQGQGLLIPHDHSNALRLTPPNTQTRICKELFPNGLFKQRVAMCLVVLGHVRR